MNIGIKRLAGRVIPKDGAAWKTLQYVYYTPKNYIRGLYRKATKNSIFFDDQELGMCSLMHPKKLEKTLQLFSPHTVLDLGCGTGASLDFFLQRGIDVAGIEGSSLAKARARHPERIELFNLNEELNLNRKFELVWCLEVVEHIHPKFVDNLMKTFANHSDRIVLSAAHPGQGGEGHFNEQPASYWIALFEQHGFTCDKASTEALQSVDEMFSDNMLTFYR